MPTDGNPATRKRIPKLSGRPEPGTILRHVVSRRRRLFSTTSFHGGSQGIRPASQRRVIEHYDDSMAIIIRDGSRFNGALEGTLPHVANAWVQHGEGRVRPDGPRRTCGTIRLRVFQGYRRQVVNSLTWCKERFGDRVRRAREVQHSLGIPTADPPPAPETPFYVRRNKILAAREFDLSVEARCRNLYAAKKVSRAV